MYDVIVVGAGPAGSMAAGVLAKNQVKVLLIDKDSFPRSKPCGDAIQGCVLHLLMEHGFRPYIKASAFHIVKAMEFYTPGNKLMQFNRLALSSGFTIRRLIFDEMLRNIPLQLGADFEQIKVTDIVVENGFVKGIKGTALNGQTVEHLAKIVIGADGATSIVRRKLDPQYISSTHRGIAIRGYAPTKENLKGVLRFHFRQKYLPGYGWVFPIQRDLANVGIILRADTYPKQEGGLDDLLHEYVQSVRDLIEDQLIDVETWQLPYGSHPYKRVFNGAMIAGDAGGMVDPLLGAGIYNAMLSGAIAAEKAVEALRNNNFSNEGLSGYTKSLTASWGQLFRKARLAQRFISNTRALDTVATLYEKNPGEDNIDIMLDYLGTKF